MNEIKAFSVISLLSFKKSLYILLISGLRVSHLKYHSFPAVASLAATMLLIASDSMLYFCVLVYIRSELFQSLWRKYKKGVIKRDERGACVRLVVCPPNSCARAATLLLYRRSAHESATASNAT